MAGKNLNLPERFSLGQSLGRGGMGEVYEAYDRERSMQVALKALPQVEPSELFLFKNEFRSLTGIMHPNLVTLYELFCFDDEWFFTMELVEGINFLEHVCPGRAPAEREEGSEARYMKDDSTVAGLRRGSPCDFARLRPALRQVATGLRALHEAGKLHRDLKPSNIKVTASGRVVILDFGLVTDLEDKVQANGGESIVGTVAYMSPEQAMGCPLTPATDWYSVGVILYQALTGRLPFQGGYRQTLADKQRLSPAAPAQLVIGVPEDLNRLCLDLLRRDPAERPAAADIARSLQNDDPDQPIAAKPSLPLVGREWHLTALREAFEGTQDRITATVYLSGPSGIGKTALLNRFLNDIAGPGVVILKGRCYEQEAVPYKALDTVIDAISRYLQRLPRTEAAAVMPRHLAELARIFPVLKRVDEVAASPQWDLASLDQHELRRRAFQALRELLARIGDRHRLVIAIDDLQWADADSVALFSEVLRPPDAPVLLLVAALRLLHAEHNLPLEPLLNPPQVAGAWAPRVLQLDPLSEEHARLVAKQLLGACNTKLVTELAHESGGNPFFLEELAAHIQEGGSHANLTLAALLSRRIRALPPDARRLLEVAAVSAGPVHQRYAYEAAGLSCADPKVVMLLRLARMTRGGDQIEPYHDRVREAVLSCMDESALRECHRALGKVLERNNSNDFERLATHFEAAGERDKAGQYYATAADQALSTLAFNRAAGLFERALRLKVSPEDARHLLARRAKALANAGRSGEAARVYEEAASRASGDEQFEYQRQMAFHYASSGHVSEGRAAFRKILDQVGLRLPETAGQAIRSLIRSRLRLSLRGLNFRQRGEGKLKGETLRRIDVAWAAATGLAMVDVLAGAAFTARSLLLALQAGEPFRIARSLAWEGAVRSLTPRDRKRALTLFEATKPLVDKLGHPYTRGIFALASGLYQFASNSWSQALAEFKNAATIFEQDCRGAQWELATSRTYELFTMLMLGEYAELSRLTPALLKDAQERGDLYTATNIGAFLQPGLCLAADRPEEAQRTVDESLAHWSEKGLHLQHVQAIKAKGWIKVYLGDGPGAWSYMNQVWPALRSYRILRNDTERVALVDLRARSALLAASAASDPRPLLDAAARDVRALVQESAPMAAPLAATTQAGLAASRGDRGGAIAYLENAVARFDELGMQMLSAAARRALGEMTGGERGRQMVEQADRWMTAQKVENPARLAIAYTNPFCWTSWASRPFAA